MDEQRLRARLAALEMAHMQHGFTTDGYTDDVLRIADAYETWLMRPEPQDAPAVASEVDPSRQHPCGAYLKPNWFNGGHWLTCTGLHVTGERAAAWGSSSDVIGWHITDDGTRFGMHHAVDQIGSNRCACGNGWPCAEVLT